jgi:hypothetical protein
VNLLFLQGHGGCYQ